MRKVRFYVHRNLHKDMWSITRRGLVVAHVPAVIMENCELRVRPNGRERVLRTKQRNVHAFVVGDIADGKGGCTAFFNKNALECTYEPYTADSFFMTDQPEVGVTHAGRVLLDSNGKMWIGGEMRLKFFDE